LAIVNNFQKAEQKKYILFFRQGKVGGKYYSVEKENH
jgi:hypothetical protein